MSAPVIIAGAGQAGAQAAVSLRQEGYVGPIILVGNEVALPYQRPPLSKGFLKAQVDEAGLLLRAEKVYVDNTVDVVLGESISAIDRAGKRLKLASGRELEYSHLVLALGSRNRRLPLEGAELDGVAYLRDLVEARWLKERLASAKRAVVIGGGFIGLEFAASARALGLEVTVVEAAPRPMSRVLSEQMSNFISARHEAEGVKVLTNQGVRRLVGANGQLTGVELSDGRVLETDLAVIGIGVLPNVELAQAAGLEISNGIVVDALLQTSDAAISAIGDCAAFPTPFANGLMRLESVQNAVDQGRAVAARLAGKAAAPFTAVPWFWSEQYDIRLQMAGITSGHDQVVLRGDPASNAFSVFCYRGGKFLGAESVNKAQDHMAVRKLLGANIELTPEQAADPAYGLRAAGAKAGR